MQRTFTGIYHLFSMLMCAISLSTIVNYKYVFCNYFCIFHIYNSVLPHLY